RRTAIDDFILFVAQVEVHNVALWSDFKPLLVWPLPITEKDIRRDHGFIVEASVAAFAVGILHVEVSLSTQRVNHLVEHGARFLLIAHGGAGGRRGRRLLTDGSGQTKAN